MLVKGDKVKLVKSIGLFNCIGTVFDVKHISDDGTILIECEVNGFAGRGIMSYDEYEKYFEKVKDNTKGKWSEWTEYKDTGLKYKTNGKTVIVKDGWGYKASASCSPYDKFCLETGIDICRKRIMVKRYIGFVKYYQNKLEESKACLDNVLKHL